MAKGLVDMAFAPVLTFNCIAFIVYNKNTLISFITEDQQPS